MRGIRSILRQHPSKVEEHQQAPEPTRRDRLEGVIRALWDAPADFNRATRRRYGMLSRHWRWDVAAFGNPEQAPRYARRHSFTAHPTTRRQRRHNARVMRVMKRRYT